MDRAWRLWPTFSPMPSFTGGVRVYSVNTGSRPGRGHRHRAEHGRRTRHQRVWSPTGSKTLDTFNPVDRRNAPGRRLCWVTASADSGDSGRASCTTRRSRMISRAVPPCFSSRGPLPAANRRDGRAAAGRDAAIADPLRSRANGGSPLRQLPPTPAGRRDAAEPLGPTAEAATETRRECQRLLALVE